MNPDCTVIFMLTDILGIKQRDHSGSDIKPQEFSETPPPLNPRVAAEFCPQKSQHENNEANEMNDR